MKTMTQPVSAAILAAALLAGSPAFALPQQRADPLACAKAVDGTPIRIGTPVLDSTGQSVGSVSLSQCSADPNEATLRIWLERSLGDELKAVPISSVTATPEAVVLSITAQELARSPDAPSLVAEQSRPLG